MPRPNQGYQLKFYKPKGYKDRQWVVYWYERGTKRERASGLKDSRDVKGAEIWRGEFIAERERPSGPATRTITPTTWPRLKTASKNPPRYPPRNE